MSERDTMVGGDHYLRMGIQPWDVVDTWSFERQIGAHMKDCLKYLLRIDMKDDPIEQVDKLLSVGQKLRSVLVKRKEAQKVISPSLCKQRLSDYEDADREIVDRYGVGS